jgi:hypothetical protein
MTTIATKNGAIITKNGSVAETCACCGGFSCAQFNSLTVTANVSNCVPSGSGLSKINAALPWIDINGFVDGESVSLPITLANTFGNSFTRRIIEEYGPTGGPNITQAQPDQAVFCKVKYAEADRGSSIVARAGTSSLAYYVPSADATVTVEISGSNASIEVLLCGRANFTGQKGITTRVSVGQYANFATGLSVYKTFPFSGAGTYSFSGVTGTAVFGTEDSWTADIDVVVS